RVLLDLEVRLLPGLDLGGHGAGEARHGDEQGAHALEPYRAGGPAAQEFRPDTARLRGQGQEARTIFLLLGARRSRVSATRADPLERARAHEDPAVEALAPCDRGHVAILVQRVRAVAGVQLLPERRARVRIGAMLEEQARERRFVCLAAVVRPEV